MPDDTSKSVTKHEKLRSWIKSRIEDGTFKAGSRLVSENELSAMFSISRYTVRHALDLLETQGYIERRRGSGTYVLAKSKTVPKKTKTVGVLLSYLDEYIFPNILKGIENVFTGLGYSIMLGITYNRVENERRFLKSCLESRVEGIIVEASKSALPNTNTDLYKKLSENGISYLFINGYYENLDCSYVVMDDAFGGYLAASKLLDSGHRKIGGIFKSDDMQGQRRFDGFSKALRKSGVTGFRSRTVFYSTDDIVKFSDAKFDGQFLEKFRGCTGIVCYNDQIAAMMTAMFQRNNLEVPGDVSIVSFDNSNLATLCSVKLTTVTHAGGLLGEKAADSLYRLICGSKRKITYMFRPELVERDSVRDISNNR